MTSSLWRWRHYRDTGKNMNNSKNCAISLNMLHTDGLCGVLGFTTPLILISKKFQSKYIYTLNSTFYKAVFFGCLIDVGAAYKSYKTPRLVIFWLIFWTHSLSCFANGNVLSTPSRFIRQSKMNIQNFCLFVIFLRGHINWVQDFHLVLYLNSQKTKTKSLVYMCIKRLPQNFSGVLIPH